MTPRQLLPLITLVLLGAIVAYLLKDTQTLGQDVGESPSAIGILNDKKSPQVTHGEGSLTVVMFSDYQCVACRRADPALQRAVAHDGNLRVIYKDWPIFGERSERAAQVAMAAHRQGIYPSLHHLLMKSPSFDDETLRAAVEGAGGNWEQVESDLLIHEVEIEKQLSANSREAFALGLQGTPGYIIGPLLIKGAMTEREFTRAFDQARSMR